MQGSNEFSFITLIADEKSFEDADDRGGHLRRSHGIQKADHFCLWLGRSRVAEALNSVR